MEINDLSGAERRVWDAFPRGEAIDFRPSPDDDPALGDQWGQERTIRAEVLRALLLGDTRLNGETAALRVAGARITGLLNVQYGTADCAIRLTSCYFDSVPNLYGAQIRQLNLSASVLPGLIASTVRIDGVLRLTDCLIRGSVRLGGAQITGAVFLERAELTMPPIRSGEVQEPVLLLNQAGIGDDIWAPMLRTRGQVRLVGATVTGSVNFNDAELSNPGGTAVDAETLTVGADIHGMRLRTSGRFNLRGARIPGQLNLTLARLSHPDGVALRASSCTIGELWLRGAAPIEGTVNLRRSQLGLLYVSPDVWPAKVRLDGLTYATLAPHEPAGHRLPVLERDDGYIPHAYEQLTAAYRRIGDEDAALTVQLAKQRRHRASLAWYAKLWGLLQDVTVGYGFRPMRAASWLLSLLLVGSVAYGLHHPRPLNADEVPHFNPVFYTLDLLLPVIDFGQEGAFSPDGWYQGLSYFLIVTGWILATTIAAGVTRSVSRQ